MNEVFTAPVGVTMVEDLFNFIFVVIVIEGGTRAGGLTLRKQFRVVGGGQLQEIGMKRRMYLVRGGQLQLVRQGGGISFEDLEGADITGIEFGYTASPFNLEP
jgi:hypothetical protein